MRRPTLLLLLALSACGTTAVSLPYSPTTAVQPAARPTVAAVTVTDARTEKDPTWLGAVRGGYGNVVRTIRTNQPVKDEVAAAFRAALAARGLLATGAAPYRVDVTVNGLSVNQWFTTDGQAAFTVEVIDTKTNQSIYQDRAEAKLGSVGALTLSTDKLANDLRDLGVKAMNQAIDTALDRPAFVAAVQRTRTAQARL